MKLPRSKTAGYRPLGYKSATSSEVLDLEGIKIHIGVDTCVLPHALFVNTADLTDRHGALCMIRYSRHNLEKVLKIMADGGYTGDNFERGVRLLLGEQAEVEIVKRNELHSFNSDYREKLGKEFWTVEFEFSYSKKNGGNVSFNGSEPSGATLSGLYHGINALGNGVGEPMKKV